MRHLDLTREDHAYFFGFLQTDGHLYAGTGQKGSATIEVSVRDAATLQEFGRMFPRLYSSITYRTIRTNFADQHSAATWTASSLAFRRELVALGVPPGRKSHIVAPPTASYHVRGYLRGLVDGDDSVGFTRTGRPFVSFVSASSALAEFFCAQVLAVTGAVRTPKPNTRDGVYAPMIANDPAATFATWLYPDARIALERKRDAAARVAAWSRPPEMRARPVSVRRWTVKGEDQWECATAKTRRKGNQVLPSGRAG